MPIRPQTSILISGGLVYWHIYAYIGRNELANMLWKPRVVFDRPIFFYLIICLSVLIFHIFVVRPLVNKNYSDNTDLNQNFDENK